MSFHLQSFILEIMRNICVFTAARADYGVLLPSAPTPRVYLDTFIDQIDKWGNTLTIINIK